uniref:Uncharacterized protein n=1 Tax=viral metagenome TaxID=1070528 RepID=A0A6C0IU89_9ZZZZ
MAQITFQVITNKDDTLSHLLKTFKTFFEPFDTINAQQLIDDSILSGYILSNHIAIDVILKQVKEYKYFNVSIRRLAPLQNFNYEYYSTPTLAGVSPRVPDSEEDPETKLFNDCLYLWTEYLYHYFNTLTKQYEATNWYQLHPVTNDNYDSYYYDGFEFEDQDIQDDNDLHNYDDPEHDEESRQYRKEMDDEEKRYQDWIYSASGPEGPDNDEYYY